MRRNAAQRACLAWRACSRSRGSGVPAGGKQECGGGIWDLVFWEGGGGKRAAARRGDLMNAYVGVVIATEALCIEWNGEAGCESKLRHAG